MAKSGNKFGTEQVFALVLTAVVLVHFVCRVWLGYGPWISADDASRTPLNGLLRNIWDLHPWLDVPIAALLLCFMPGLPFALRRTPASTTRANTGSGSSAKSDDKGGAAQKVRNNLLSGRFEALGITKTAMFPVVYGVVIDECYKGMFSTVYGLSNGSAGVYGPAVSISDDLAHQAVRDAAVTLVKDAQEYGVKATPTTNFGFPPLGHVRLYFLCFDGVRMVETTSAALESGRDDGSKLWQSAQRLIAEVRQAR